MVEKDRQLQETGLQETRQISQREFYNVIFVHKWTILIAFIIMMAAIFWGLSLRERLFIASVKFYNNRSLQQQASLRYIGRADWEEAINSLAEMGRSQGVLMAAARKYDQARGWENPPESRVQLIAAGFATMVEVSPVPETDIINILVRDADADTALMIANIYGRSFVSEFRRVSRQSQSRTFFQSAIADVENKINSAKDAKAKLQEDNELYAWQNEEVALTESIQIMTRELTTKRAKREMLEKQNEFENRFFDEGENFILTSSLKEDDLLRQMEFRLVDLRLELMSLEGRYTPDHRLVVAKRSELKMALEQRRELMNRKILEHRQHIEELLEGERVIEASITQYSERLAKIPASVVQIAYYDSYINTQWDLYSELITKYNDALASDEQTLLENQLVQLGPPNIGGIEGETQKVVYVVVAPIFAFLLAVSIAFMAEATNHTFQKTAEIEDYSGLPVLATFRKT